MDGSPEGAILSKLPSPIKRALEAVLGLNRFSRIAEQAYADTPGEYCRDFLLKLGAKLEIEGEEHVPTDGGIMVVANHNTGLLDILALAGAVSQTRDKVKIVVNELALHIFPGLKDAAICVDMSDKATDESRKNTRQQITTAIEGGNAVLLFPAGTVGKRNKNDEIVDGPWQRGGINAATDTGAVFVPAHIDARNSDLFYSLRNIRGIGEALSTSLFFREILKQKGKTTKVHFGKPYPPSLMPMLSARSRTHTLRSSVESLGNR